MFDYADNHYDFTVDIAGKPLSKKELLVQKRRLHSLFISNLSFIVVLIVLGVAVTIRAFMLGYDIEHELFNISLYVGLWFGLFASMLVMLLIGQATVWITSVNILASALACMWVLTRYDEVLKGIESTYFVDEKQFAYIRKASSHFEELYCFSEKIIMHNRLPFSL